jgi:hypothetical protein
MLRPEGPAWLTWEIHRRSRVIAEARGIELYEITSSNKGARR